MRASRDHVEALVEIVRSTKSPELATDWEDLAFGGPKLVSCRRNELSSLRSSICVLARNRMGILPS
jgi:hypothetical protein